MKLLHFADLHLDAAFAWAGVDLGRRRRMALRDTLRAILELAAAEHVDAILCAGDLYEQDRFTPDTLAFLRAAFAEVAPLPIYVSPGNHDWLSPRSIYSQVQWPENVHVFNEDHLRPVTLADGLTLWGAAHCAPANTDNVLESFAVDRGGTNIGLFHGSERGSFSFQDSGKQPFAPFRADEIASAGLAHAFVGHFHAPADEKRFTYPGNPDPLSFGEHGRRGVVLATVTPEGITTERRVVAQTHVEDLVLSVTGCTSASEVRAALSALLADRHGIARVTAEGELDPSVDLTLADLREVPNRLDAMFPRFGTIRAAYDLDAIRAEPTVRGQFVTDVLAAQLDPDLERRVIATGLRALDGRKDLEVP